MQWWTVDHKSSLLKMWSTVWWSGGGPRPAAWASWGGFSALAQTCWIDLVKLQIQVQGGHWDSAFPTGSHVMPKLLVWGPQLKEQAYRYKAKTLSSH